MLGEGSGPVFMIARKRSRSRACERGLGDGRAVKGCERELDEMR